MRTRPTVVVSAALLLATAGCAADRATSVPDAIPGPSQMSIAPTADIRAHAAAVYVQMWRAYERALSEGDADSPYLTEYTEGPALLVLTRAVRSTVAAGLRGAGTTVLSPKVTAVQPVPDPARATLTDCMDTSPTRLYKADGSAYADITGGRRLMTATVVLSGDGKWRVNQIQLGQVGSC